MGKNCTKAYFEELEKDIKKYEEDVKKHEKDVKKREENIRKQQQEIEKQKENIRKQEEETRKKELDQEKKQKLEMAKNLLKENIDIDIILKVTSLNKEDSIKLATPPSPEEAYLRSSLVPGMLEAISKNLRYFDSFKMFEMAQVFIKGEYHESSEDETLPIHKKLLTGSIVGSNPKEIFYELKGAIENISRYTHMKELNSDT